MLPKIVIGVVILFATFFILGSNFRDKRPEPTNVPLPSGAQKGHEQQGKQFESSFQSTVNKHCKPTGDNANEYKIQLSDLLFKVDTELLGTDKINCWGIFNGEEYLWSKLSNYGGLVIYNDNSEDLGHGGKSRIGPLGLPIKTYADVEITGYFSDWEIFFDFAPGKQPVIVRGIKTLKLNTGEKIYVLASRVAIPSNDERLINFLENWVYLDSYHGKLLPTEKQDEIEKAIIKEFFGDESKYTNEQKQAIEEIQKTLSAFEAK